MPTYQIKAPNGKTYRVKGPDGATQDQVREQVLRQFPEAGEKPKPEEDSWLEGLAKGTGAALKGAAKAVAGPLDLAMEVAGEVNQGVNYALTEGGAGLLDLAGADKAAQRLRQSGREMRPNTARNANVLQVRNALDTVAPTPKGYGAQEVASEFITGAAIPFKTAQGGPTAPKAVNALTDAQQVVTEGAKRKVPVMTTDVVPPKSGMGRYVKQTLPEKIPFAGTSGNRAAQQAARQNAVREVVEEFGGDTGRALFDDGDTLTQQVAKQLAEQRGAKLTALKTAKNSVINGIEGNVATPRAVAAIDEQIAQLSKTPTDELRPVIAKLQNWKSVLKGETTRIDTGVLDASGNPIFREIPPEMSLSSLEQFRKIMGESFKSPELAGIRSVGEGAVSKIYGPLRGDMAKFIGERGGEAALTKWSKANAELAAMAGELKSSAFKNVLRDADVTPEAVSRILFGSADNTSDMARLVSNLDPAGRRKVQGALMTRAWEKAHGADGVSVEVFLNNLKQLSKKIGVAFDGKDKASLEGVRRLLEATRRGAEAGAKIRTGEQNLPAVMGVAATQALGFTGGVASLGVGGLLARVYESPAVRNLLIGLGKTKPGSVAEASIVRHIMRVSAPVVNNWKDEMARAANDNLGALAAQDSQGSQQEAQ